MNEIQLSAGPIEYTDTGGDGPVLVLLHGLMMDASLWDEVTACLAPGQRCLVPVLPLGAHRHAMKPDADLSPAGIARLGNCCSPACRTGRRTRSPCPPSATQPCIKGWRRYRARRGLASRLQVWPRRA